MDFQITFSTISIAIIKLFVLMLIGYVLYLKKLIDDKFTDTLSLLLVRIFFPALIVAKIISNFSFAEYTYWWILPLSSILFSLIGMIIGRLVYEFNLRDSDLRKEVMCSCGFQNAGYLPMNLILFSFAGVLEDRLLVYLFLFIMGFNTLMWSLIPLFLSGKLNKAFNIKIFLNPPVVTIIFSLIWVALLGKNTLPPVLMDPIKHLGQASFSIAMITLGAYLCRYKAYELRDKKPVIGSIVAKLGIFPILVLVLLRFIPIGMDYKFFLFLQAIMPTAVSLVVIGSYTGADNRFFAATIFYTHIAAILTMPLWLYVFQIFIG